MRRQVQQHVGRLPVSYYDQHQTGVLVSRIMSDVEGVRNLVGTGLIHLVGGTVDGRGGAGRAVLHQRQAHAAFARRRRGVRAHLAEGFQEATPGVSASGARSAPRSPAGLPSRARRGARGEGAYHAEGREAQVFSGGVERLLQNVYMTLTRDGGGERIGPNSCSAAWARC